MTPGTSTGFRRYLPPGGDAATAIEAGRDLRARMARTAHDEVFLPEGRDPLRIIKRTHEGRIPELIGVRVNRMLQSAHAYFRGTVDVMTRDLAAGPTSGIHLVIDADAHLGNFGLYASPERRIVFDLNDFDEAGVGPWEWDLRRLGVSLVLELASHEASEEVARVRVADMLRAYRDELRRLSTLPATDRFFASVDAADELLGNGYRSFDRGVAKARRRTSEQALGKVARRDERGRAYLDVQPPLLVPYPPGRIERVRHRLRDYLDTLHTDRALLLSQYRLVDVARRVVGVSSVGTHCSIVLLQGPSGENLILQVKEALPSVLETYGGLRGVEPRDGTAEDRHCRRVTGSQRVLQSTSDPFLGRTVDPDGRNYFWRQFRDMKGSIDLTLAGPDEIRAYAALCARQLARAHAQSPDSFAVVGYLGRSDQVPEAMAQWCCDYARIVEQDWLVFGEAVEAGRFPRTDG
ncbi:DUF2252 domain-containing protein [Brachybacterium huguangmaarense]